MELERNLKITLTVEEANEILKKHFKSLGYDIDHVSYNIEEVGGDFMDRYPGVDTVTKVILSGKEVK